MKFACIIFIVLLIIPVYAQEDIRPTSRITGTVQNSVEIKNPKAVSEMDIKMIQSGSLEITGSISKANLSVYVPKEFVSSRTVTAPEATWKIISDNFGNNIIFFEWSNPSGVAAYRIESIINSKAKHLPSKKNIGSDAKYLNETKSILFSSEIRTYAFPFEKTLDRTAELNTFVNDYMEYDISLVGERKSSIWALENRRGVCVEHANLLTALLRTAGIPTRYIVGYAYSTVDKKLIGHTWVEVLAQDGTWIPFDPTWLQAGYIDATHIKTGALLDDDQKDILMYVGNGQITWNRNEEQFEILDFKEDILGDITIQTRAFGINEQGFLRANVKTNECTVLDININSCVDQQTGRNFFDFKNPERKVWFCGETDVYWVFDIKKGLNRNTVYTCPVTVYDETGGKQTTEIEVTGTRSQADIFISGPDVVSINEEFTLEAHAGTDFIFFSPTERYQEKTVSLSIGQPGSYNFYLYEDGAYAQKTVKVLDQKDFSLAVEALTEALDNESFVVTARVKNLLGKQQTAKIQIEFENEIMEKTASFVPYDEKTFVFTLEPKSPGLKKIIASVITETITTYTTSIDVKGKELPLSGGERVKGFFDAIIELFRSIIDAILNLF